MVTALSCAPTLPPSAASMDPCVALARQQTCEGCILINVSAHFARVDTEEPNIRVHLAQTPRRSWRLAFQTNPARPCVCARSDTKLASPLSFQVTADPNLRKQRLRVE